MPASGFRNSRPTSDPHTAPERPPLVATLPADGCITYGDDSVFKVDQVFLLKLQKPVENGVGFVGVIEA
jgi:hypothetical protein